MRNTHAAPEKRSPIKAPPLRMPGQSLQTRLHDILLDQWIPWFIIPVLFWLVAVAEWVRLLAVYNPTWISSITLTVSAAAVTGMAAYKILRLRPLIHAVKQGMEGERVVGQFLDEYCRERKYKVFHDILGEGFNIDHVLIGPGGVFTVDTKTISKPTVGEPVVTYDGETVAVDGHEPDRDPVVQAKAEARHLREVLAETTGRHPQDIPVRAVVLFPGWFIEGSSSGREVWVLNLKVLLSFLEHETRQLSTEDIALFTSRLAGHVRHGTKA